MILFILTLAATLALFILVLEFENIMHYFRAKKIEKACEEVRQEVEQQVNTCSCSGYELPEPPNGCGALGGIDVSKTVMIDPKTRKAFDADGNFIGLAEGEILAGKFEIHWNEEPKKEINVKMDKKP